MKNKPVRVDGNALKKMDEDKIEQHMLQTVNDINKGLSQNIAGTDMSILYDNLIDINCLNRTFQSKVKAHMWYLSTSLI